ncbi:MAG: metal-dependent hydrolase [Phormidesmis sp.]
MPSPIAHSVSGYALTHLPFVKARTFRGQLWPVTPLAALYGVFVSNLPDLDFVPQLLTGIRFHRGPSHSLVSALLVSGLLVWIVRRYRHSRPRSGRQPSYRVLFAFTFGLYGSHILLDLLTTGGSGLPLFWPLSPQTFQFPFPIFPSVHHSRGLWHSSHLVFISAELLYSVCLLGGLRFFRAATKTETAQHPSQEL